MGKNQIVKMYQTARFMEWIGNFKKAEAIYKEIEQSDQTFSSVIFPTIQAQKKKIADMKQESIIEIKQKKELGLYSLEELKPKRFDHLGGSGNLSVKWDYSISVVSTVDEDLRLEIRGFNSKEVEADLKFDINEITSGWNITNFMSEPSEEKRDLIWFTAKNNDNYTQLFLSIDRWGLLNGIIVTNKNELGDTLGSIHLLLSCLSNSVWRNI